MQSSLVLPGVIDGFDLFFTFFALRLLVCFTINDRGIFPKIEIGKASRYSLVNGFQIYNQCSIFFQGIIPV